MGPKILFFVLHILAVKDVFSYPASDYIFAYIPIEEFAYLAQVEIEIPALTSSNVVYADGYDIGTALYIDELISPYCSGKYNARSLQPQYASQGYSVYSPQSSYSVYQPASLPTVTLLPPVSVQSASILPTSTLPVPNLSLPVPSPSLPIPNAPQATVFEIKEYEFELEGSGKEVDIYSSSVPANSFANSLPVPQSIYTQGPVTIYPQRTADSVPYYGTKRFGGIVPASGTVSIYGSSYETF